MLMAINRKKITIENVTKSQKTTFLGKCCAAIEDPDVQSKPTLFFFKKNCVFFKKKTRGNPFFSPKRKPQRKFFYGPTNFLARVFFED